MHNRRKRRVIDKKQQIRFALEISFYAVLFPLIFLLLAVGEHFSCWLIGRNAEAIHPLLRGFLAFVLDHWWGALLALGIVGYISVWFSHKIFGPVYRFQDALQEKRTNSLVEANCKLRRKDYFQEFAKDLDDYLNKGVASAVEREARPD